MSTAETAELVVMPSNGRELANRDGEWSVAQIIDQKRKVVEIMNAVMKPDEHYGVIPGAKKPSLWKPGAETLCLMFRLDPEYEVMKSTEEPTLISFTIRCVLNHINTGSRIASGLGSCNSREEKYKRQAPKLCPKCNKPAIIKGKEEYGGGWVCYKKKDGCGANFKDGDKAIEGQSAGIADPADLHNTILKMACKRALIAAVLNGTAASDCFAQDLEDLPPQFMEQPTGPNIPAPRKGQTEPSTIRQPPAQRPIAVEAERLDREYAATVNGTLADAPDEPPQARIIDDKWVEVIDAGTGEVTKEKRPTPTRFKRMQSLRSELKIDQARWEHGLRPYGVNSSTLLTADQTEHLIARLEKAMKTQEEVRGKAVSLIQNVFPNATVIDEEEANKRAAAPTEGEQS